MGDPPAALARRLVQRLLVQAVATRYRISGQAKDDLLQSVVGVLDSP